MMQIKMLRGERGSEDGVSVKFYEKDEAYEVGTDLGSTFVKSGAAERTGGDEVLTDEAKDDTPAADPINTKAEGAAPENRALKGGQTIKAPSPTPYQVGKVYDQDGKQFVAVAGENGGPATLKPVTELSEEERKPLEASGQLKKA